MSSVYRAVHIQSGHVVALKVLPRTLARHSTLLQRFLREAKSAESLEHPNIVAIYDRGFAEGRHYLVLEYVDGSDLHDYVQRRGPLPPDEAVRVIRQAAEALRHAAARGITHRDIKPANLLRAKDGTIKIIDLGLALQAEEEDERVTRDGTTVGTVDYMSPEQARDSRATGVKSDLYSLGCTFYYLLTGSPPYPGGDVLDKLRRHATTPPPDARQARGDLPEEISRLVRRMMAKRPERRFRDYDELIAELDQITASPPSLEPGPPGGDHDRRSLEDPETIPLAALENLPREPGRSLQPASRVPPRSGSLPSRPATRDSGTLSARDGESARPPQPTRSSSDIERLDLTKPAAIEDDSPHPPSASSRSVPFLISPALDLEEELDLAPPTSPIARLRSASGDDWKASRPWVVVALVGAVLVILLLLGLRMAIRERTELGGGGGVDSADSPIGLIGLPDMAKSDSVTRSALPPTRGGPMLVPGSGPAAPELFNWVEPVETPDMLATEQVFPPAWETKFPPQPTHSAGGRVVIVRRVGASGAKEVSTLRAAFDDLGAVVEVADNGPFFEADFRVPGEDRVVRAASGFRPILVVESPNTEYLKEQPASIGISGGSLTLEGLDLVVKVGHLTTRQTALFLVRNGSLTLRNCTVTIVGPNTRPYVAIAVEEPEQPGAPRASAIRLERTLIRGPVSSLFRLVGAGTTIVVDRSVLLSGNGPLLSASGGTLPGAAEPRRLDLIRSIAASFGPTIEMAVSRFGGGDAPVLARLLGSTIARFEGSTCSAPWALRVEPTTDPRTILDLQAGYTTFTGWSRWLVAGPDRATHVADVAAATRHWPELTELDFQPQGWSPSVPVERLGTSTLREWAPAMAPTLDRAAVPSPNLMEKTLESIPRQVVPELAGTSPSPGPLLATDDPDGIASTLLQELRFDTQAAPWWGDLGRFVRESLRRDARWLRVRVVGGGTKTMTPVRLPNGVSLEVIVEPSVPGAEPLTWTPAPDSQEEALIRVQDADLVLSGVRLVRRDLDGPALLVRVEDGHLTAMRSWFTASGDGGERPLIHVRAATTRDLSARPVPVLPHTDRPVYRLVDCLLLSSGDLIVAELARGVLALEQCVLATEGSAVVLRPERVRRDRFSADLWLDSCTLAAEQTVVDFGRWPGATPGPDRPWLVSSRNCAFLDLYQRGNTSRRGVMLRLSDPEALARGAIAWQSSGDAYDMTQYVVVGTIPSGTTRADIRSRWIEFWGEEHIRGAVGPTPGSGRPVVRLPVDRLRPGEFAPGDLDVLDPPRVGAELERLGITPTAPSATAPRRR